jgi:hypothetical protein
MKDRFLMTDTFIESMSDFDKGLKTSLWKCLSLLCKNHLHPSLNTEKLDGIFSSRINIDYRLIHEPIRDVFRLLFAGKHDEAYRFANAYEQSKKFHAEPYLGQILRDSPSPYFRQARFKLKGEKKLTALFRKFLHRLYNWRIKRELVPGQTYDIKALKRYFQ